MKPRVDCWLACRCQELRLHYRVFFVFSQNKCDISKSSVSKFLLSVSNPIQTNKKCCFLDERAGKPFNKRDHLFKKNLIWVFEQSLLSSSRLSNMEWITGKTEFPIYDFHRLPYKLPPHSLELRRLLPLSVRPLPLSASPPQPDAVGTCCSRASTAKTSSALISEEF